MDDEDGLGAADAVEQVLDPDTPKPCRKCKLIRGKMLPAGKKAWLCSDNNTPRHIDPQRVKVIFERN